nr:hypothetical protein [Tanacetum cinerariifolium]
MDLFAFICHFDPTKVRIEERDLAKSKVNLMKMTEGHTVSLDPPVTAASGDSDDSIDKLFDEGNDVGQEQSVERDEEVLEETVAKDASEKLREDYHARASSTGGKSLAIIRDLVSAISSVPFWVTEPPTVVFVPPTPDDGTKDSVSGPNLRTFPPFLRYVVSSDDSYRSSSCSEIKSFARSVSLTILVKLASFT